MKLIIAYIQPEKLNDVKQVLGITLKVHSVEKAAAFLRGQGLLGDVTVGSLELDTNREVITAFSTLVI